MPVRYSRIVRLVWPLALGMINNAVMQFVDRLYLSHDSLNALEAVLPAGMLMWIFAGFFQSFIGYSSVLVGHCHGAGDESRCRTVYRVARRVAYVCGALSLPLVAVGTLVLFWTTPSRRLFDAEAVYFGITTVGSIAIYGQMAAASYFTGRGRTRIVFWANLIGNVFNVLADPVLIFGWWGFPKLGIAGAAVATVMAMCLQWAILDRAAAWSCAREGREPEGGDAKEILRKLLRYGLPAGLYSVLNILSFAVFVFVTGGVGEVELAVSNACFTVNYLLIAPMEGFSIGVSTLVAQAIGRGNPQEALQATRRTLTLGVGFVAVLSIATLVFAHPLLALFAAEAGESSAAFHALGARLFLLMAAWQVFDAADVIICGALKGAGDTRFVTGWMLFNAFAVWLPLVFVVRSISNTMPALWSTMVFYVVVLCVGSLVRWRGGWWRRNKVI